MNQKDAAITGDGDAVVVLRNVSKCYGGDGSAAASTVVLDGIDLSIPRGQSVAIMGPSGSGKTTLLNLIGALDEPTSGEVIVAGESLGAMSPSALASFRNRKIGFVFQSHHLLPQCTAVENVLVPTLASGSRDDRAGAAERAGALLRRVGLGERMHHRPGQMSGGEQQRVALVRALINEPAVLLADEPTGSLDHPRACAMVELLKEINASDGVTLIVVTHDGELAGQMQRVLRLRDGKLHDGDVAMAAREAAS